MGRAVAIAIAIAALAACGHPPKQRAAAAEIPITGPATFAGAWVTSDDMDWSYRLVIRPDGRFVLGVDRGRMGKCEQKGSLVPGAEPKAYTLTIVRDSCTPNSNGGSLPVTIDSYTGEAMTLAYMIGTTPTHRVYARDPKVPRN